MNHMDKRYCGTCEGDDTTDWCDGSGNIDSNRQLSPAHVCSTIPLWNVYHGKGHVCSTIPLWNVYHGKGPPELPLHVNDIPRVNLTVLRNMMDDHTRQTFDCVWDFYARTLPISPKKFRRYHGCDLTGADVSTLQKFHLISPIAFSEIRGTVITFCVPEVEKKRKRWVVYPK